jgi:hypothetical protein
LLEIQSGKLLDPYCDSDSSFASSLECGLTEMHGFDINPLAVLISEARFMKVSINKIVETKKELKKIQF